MFEKVLSSGNLFATSECSSRGDWCAQASRSVLHAATQVKRIGRSTNAIMAPSTSSGQRARPLAVRALDAAGSLDTADAAGASPAAQSAFSIF